MRRAGPVQPGRVHLERIRAFGQTRRPRLSNESARESARESAGESAGGDGTEPVALNVVVPARFQPILDEARPLAEAFRAHGHTLYLVGGIVRDTLLGLSRSAPDIDCTTDASPDQIEAIVRSLKPESIWTVGKKFGTIGAHLRMGVSSGTPKDGPVRPVEITTHRAEAYNADSRKPDVEFSTDINADLSRRDFTVNAMALSILDLELIDPFNGAVDLANKVLRTPLSPAVSFTDDPLRMLRAARFIAGYELAPDEAVVAAVREFGERLEIVSAERVRDELDKLLITTDPSAGLWFIVETNLAAYFLPELPAMALEQDPIHRHKDVLAHTLAVVAKTSPERVLRMAALLHDIAKPKTRSIGPHGVSFHHHDIVGARMARDRLRALRYSNDDVHDISELVALHLRFHTYSMGWTDSAVRRYVRDAGPLLDKLNELTRCDCTTRNAKKAAILAKRMDDLEDRIAELRAQEEIDSIRPDLDGVAVMEYLAAGPGRHIGEALNMLLEARMEEGPLGEDEAKRRLDVWWAKRSAAPIAEKPLRVRKVKEQKEAKEPGASDEGHNSV
jgi:poly(A) polymerase